MSLASMPHAILFRCTVVVPPPLVPLDIRVPVSMEPFLPSWLSPCRHIVPITLGDCTRTGSLVVVVQIQSSGSRLWMRLICRVLMLSAIMPSESAALFTMLTYLANTLGRLH